MKLFFQLLSDLFKWENKMQSPNEKIPIAFSFNIAKTKDEGEDADPVFIHKDKLYFLSVCDGMGGAGGTTYEFNGFQKSGAYLSSRLVNKQAENYFSNKIEKGESFSENNLDEFKDTLLIQLQKKLNEVKIGSDSKLRSKLLKDLPTTFSGLYILEEENRINVNSIWAGDSRNYLFTEIRGLQQLTVDDLKHKYDPLENLTKDSPLDNVVSADGDFKLRLNKITVASPCILFAATDGCYGYFNTPMQFEFAILKSLLDSNHLEEWKSNLINVIGSVAGDDFSISLLAIGFKSFQEIKNNFSQRMQDVYRQFLMDLQKEEEVMGNLFEQKKTIEENIKKIEIRRRETQNKIWEAYKKQYLEHINSQP